MIRHEGAATKKLQFMLTTVFTLRGLTLTAGVTGVSLLGKKVKKRRENEHEALHEYSGSGGPICAVCWGTAGCASAAWEKPQ